MASNGEPCYRMVMSVDLLLKNCSHSMDEP